jgi:hypothetical protein
MTPAACQHNGMQQLQQQQQRQTTINQTKDWVEQLCQLGLKNDRRTKGVRNRDQKHGLCTTKWEQLSGNQNVQRTKHEAKESWKRKLQHDGGAETAAALQMETLFIVRLLLNKTTCNGLGRTGCSNLKKSSC